MSQESISVIIGGAISLASICFTSIVGILTIIFTNYFQNKRDERARKWALEDQRSTARAEMLKIQKFEVEQFLEKYVSHSNRLLEVETAALKHEVLRDKAEDMKRMGATLATMLAKISNLDDKEIVASLQELMALYAQEYENAKNLEKAIRDKDEPDPAVIINRLSEFQNKINSIIAHIHTRLDTMD